MTLNEHIGLLSRLLTPEVLQVKVTKAPYVDVVVHKATLGCRAPGWILSLAFFSSEDE